MSEKLIEIAATLGSVILLGLFATKRIESMLDNKYDALNEQLTKQVEKIDERMIDRLLQIERLNTESNEIYKSLLEKQKENDKIMGQLGALKEAPVNKLVEEWNRREL